MITFLEGILEEKGPTRIVINVQGVGYEVFIPLCTYDKLPSPNETCRILTFHHVREDTQALFGFAAETDRNMFARLLCVSGIGPKLALSALSGLSIRDFKAAIVESDVKRISSISGIGKKTAERIVIELRDKLSAGEAFEAVAGEPLGDPEDPRPRDAVMALISLGYKQADAWKMARKALQQINEDSTVEDIVRQSLTG